MKQIFKNYSLKCCLIFAIIGISGFYHVALAQGIKDTINLTVVEIRDSSVKLITFPSNSILKTEVQKASTRDLGEYLRSIPNVSGVRKGGASLDPVVRGFKFSQLNVNVGGGLKVENGCPNRMDPVTSHVEPEDIESIEVLKGPFVLKYGPSFGGIINLKTENPQPYEKFEIHANAMVGFETNWNGQKEHLSILGGNKKVYFLLSGGFRNYGNYRSGASEGNDTSFMASFKKYNYTAKIGFSPSKNQQIMLSFDEIHGQNVLYPALPMDEKSDDTRMLALDYHSEYLTGKLKKVDVKIYQSDVCHNMDNHLRSTWSSKQMISIVDAVNTGGRAEFSFLFSKFKVSTGLDLEHIYKDGTRTMTMQMMGTTSSKKSNLWKDGQITNAALFGECRTNLGSLDLMGALRFDFNDADSKDTLMILKDNITYFGKSNSQFKNISASLGIERKLNKNLKLALALGRGMRSPNMLERFIKLMAVGLDNYDYLGNPQLKPETNYEADLTLSYSKHNYGSLSFNMFYSRVQDYIYSELLPSSVVKPQTLGVFGVKQFSNVDYVILKGFEFGYSSPVFGNLWGSIVGSLTYGEIPEVRKYIISGNQVTGETLMKNDALSEIPPFESSLTLNYSLLKGKLVPRLMIRAVAAQKHISEAFYEKETPGFVLANLSVNYKINRFARINAGVNNIFDKAYYEHLNRKIIGSSVNLFEPGRSFYISAYLSI
jgi:iron complex outermembrane receptor protein